MKILQIDFAYPPQFAPTYSKPGFDSWLKLLVNLLPGFLKRSYKTTCQTFFAKLAIGKVQCIINSLEVFIERPKALDIQAIYVVGEVSNWYLSNRICYVSIQVLWWKWQAINIFVVTVIFMTGSMNTSTFLTK